MKRRTVLLILPAAVAVAAVFAAPASAAYPIVNPSFETGTFFGWTVVPAPFGGAAQVLPGSAPYNGSGSFLAKLTPGQVNVYTTVSQTVSAATGARLTGWAYFENHDGEFGVFCDDAYVKVNGTTVFHGNSCTTGTTPWIHWSYTVPVAGAYTIQSGVDNVGDGAVPSFLFVDDFRYLGPYIP